MGGYSLSRDEGWTYAPFGFTVKASESSGAAGAAVFEYVAKAGEDPPEHVHPTEDEMFYVVEGEVVFRCEDDVFNVGPGGFVFLPRGLPHSYAVVGEAARLLAIGTPPRTAPGSWDGFVSSFEGRGTLVAEP